MFAINPSIFLCLFGVQCKQGSPDVFLSGTGFLSPSLVPRPDEIHNLHSMFGVDPAIYYLPLLQGPDPFLFGPATSIWFGIWFDLWTHSFSIDRLVIGKSTPLPSASSPLSSQRSATDSPCKTRLNSFICLPWGNLTTTQDVLGLESLQHLRMLLETVWMDHDSTQTTGQPH